jgi:lipopolysaccharide transport system permease protein
MVSHRTRIRPPTRWGANRIPEVWPYRELVYFLAKRDVQVRYRQSFVGLGWVMLQPLALMGIFTLVFSQLVGVDSEGIPYPVYALAGITVWTFVAQAIGQAGSSLVSDANLVSKVFFPRLIVPFAKVIALLVDLVAVVVLLLVVSLIVVGLPTVAVVTVPLWLFLAGVFALGTGLLAAALNVRYRDVAVVIPLILQVGLFLTPVAYPASLVTGKWEILYALNPAASCITGVRWALFGTETPALVPLLVSIVVTIIVLVVATLYFTRSEQHFADVI